VTINKAPVPDPNPPIHPFWWMVLFLPFGATTGFVSVTIAYTARQQGLGDAAIAEIVAISLLPHTFKFLWAPIPDTTFSRRGWYLASNVVSTITLIMLGLVPVHADTVSLLKVAIFINSFAITFLGMAVEGLLANVVTERQRGSASGWLQAGNLGGTGIGGGVALWLAQRIGVSGAFVIAALALMTCSMALLKVREPKRVGHESIAGALRSVILDLWHTVVRSRTGLLAMILCFLPVGAAAATNLFAAMADRWNTPADAVALFNGVLAGLAAAVGCMVGGWLSDRMDRKVAYAVSGCFLAIVAVAMYLGPRNALGYGIFTLSYQFGSGVAYGAFTGFVLEAIGRGAAATKYNVLASLSNIPIWYMTELLGRSSERWGPSTMLLVDAASEVVGIVIFLSAAYLLLGRIRYNQPDNLAPSQQQ
jgi:MFS transporter, PAT family, beta-lactamase induction signal transducer AmpG